MLMSDWMSDVCSSDLVCCRVGGSGSGGGAALGGTWRMASSSLPTDARLIVDGGRWPVRHLSATIMRTATEVPFPAKPLSRRNMSCTVEPVVARSNSAPCLPPGLKRSEEHTSELQSLMRISYAVFCLTKQKLRSQRDNSVVRTTDLVSHT